MLIGGLLCVGAGMLFFKRLPEVRRHVHPIYVRRGILPPVARGLQAAEGAAESQIEIG